MHSQALVLFFLAAATVSAVPHALTPRGGAHAGRLAVAARGEAPDSLSVRDLDLDKRQGTSARMTYYYTSTGLGACGQLHQDNEWTIAVNTAQFAGGSVCGQSITISYNGKTATGLAADECPSCSYGELDLSPGLFQHFASFDAGTFYADWNWGSGAPPPPAPTPTPTSTKPAYTPPTSTYTPPTSTSETPTPTSTYVPPTSTSTTSTTTSTTSSLSSPSPTPTSASSEFSVAPSSTLSASASASASVAVGGSINVQIDNFAQIASLVDSLGRVVCQGNVACHA